MANINIPLDDDLHRRLKLNAIASRRTLKDHIIVCIEDRLGNDPLLSRHLTASPPLPAAPSLPVPRPGVLPISATPPVPSARRSPTARPTRSRPAPQGGRP